MDEILTDENKVRVSESEKSFVEWLKGMKDQKNDDTTYSLYCKINELDKFVLRDESGRIWPYKDLNDLMKFKKYLNPE